MFGRDKNKEQREFATQDFGHCLRRFSILSRRETECLQRNQLKYKNGEYDCRHESADVAAAEKECQKIQRKIEELDRELYSRPGQK